MNRVVVNELVLDIIIVYEKLKSYKNMEIGMYRHTDRAVEYRAWDHGLTYLINFPPLFDFDTEYYLGSDAPASPFHVLELEVCTTICRAQFFLLILEREKQSNFGGEQSVGRDRLKFDKLEDIQRKKGKLKPNDQIKHVLRGKQ